MFKNKIVSLKALLSKLPALRRQKKVIAFTNGCFDLMHEGHVSYLEKAKKNSRILIVGLNSDKSIQTIKGKNRPICPQRSRAAVLASLACVDFVILFDEATPYKLIAAIGPDVLVKGADYKANEVAGADIMKARGGKIELLPLVKGFSTTQIVKKILASS